MAEKIAVHCKSIQEAIEYVNIRKAEMPVYEISEATLRRYFSRYPYNFCVEHREAFYYCNRAWFLEKGYRILTLREFKNMRAGIDMRLQVVKRVISSDPATAVFWSDRTKTVVKCSEGDKFDREKGFLMAYFLKHSGLTKTKAAKFLRTIKPKEVKK